MFLSGVVAHLLGGQTIREKELLLELTSSINLQLAIVAAGIRRKLRVPFVIFEAENPFSILFVNFDLVRM